MIALNDLYPCFQGEGVHTGVPMLLVRLQGCGVGCPWCDTRETWDLYDKQQVRTLDQALGQNPRWAYVDPTELAVAGRDLAGPRVRWAMVTGGEPAEQFLAPLVQALAKQEFLSAVETSGTSLGVINSGAAWVCVSPKIGMPGGRSVHKEILQIADEIKFVVAKATDLEKLDHLLESTPLKPECQIALQPVSQSENATKLCATICMTRGWRLSLQIHKYVGFR